MADRVFLEVCCTTNCGPTNTEFCRIRFFSGDAKNKCTKNVCQFMLDLYILYRHTFDITQTGSGRSRHGPKVPGWNLK